MVLEGMIKPVVVEDFALSTDVWRMMPVKSNSRPIDRGHPNDLPLSMRGPMGQRNHRARQTIVRRACRRGRPPRGQHERADDELRPIG